MLQELVNISHATALDLNMGYFTIRLDKDASKICTIIFFIRAILLPQEEMHDGYGRFSDILQGMLELMESLEHVQAPIKDLLCISGGSLEDPWTI